MFPLIIITYFRESDEADFAKGKAPSSSRHPHPFTPRRSQSQESMETGTHLGAPLNTSTPSEGSATVDSGDDLGENSVVVHYTDQSGELHFYFTSMYRMIGYPLLQFRIGVFSGDSEIH